jgi:hypothetical protein
MALVGMSVVEQRYRAVLAVGRGEPKIVVAAQFGVSRQTLHTWLTPAPRWRSWCASYAASTPGGGLVGSLSSWSAPLRSP